MHAAQRSLALFAAVDRWGVGHSIRGTVHGRPCYKPNPTRISHIHDQVKFMRDERRQKRLEIESLPAFLNNPRLQSLGIQNAQVVELVDTHA